MLLDIVGAAVRGACKCTNRDLLLLVMRCQAASMLTPEFTEYWMSNKLESVASRVVQWFCFNTNGILPTTKMGILTLIL